MARIRIGCSGWNYRDWRGRFYPEKMPAKDWFGYYAEHFDTVEINNSFYRLPTPETFGKWREQAPPGFRYAVKASRFLTHRKKLKDPEQPLALLTGNARHLKSFLGPLLYQLPPNWKLNRERLEQFLRALPKGFTHVLEFREQGWMADEVLELLDRHGAGFCTHDMRGLDVPRRTTGGIAYVRFHGAGGKYRGRYAKSALRDWAEWMIGQAGEGRAVWAYFNNDVEAAAIRDARTLREMIGANAG